MKTITILVCWFHTIAQLLEKNKFCRTLCDFYIKDMVLWHYLSKLSNEFFFESEISKYLKVVHLQTKH